MHRADSAPDWAPGDTLASPHRWQRLITAGLATAQWFLVFGISFAITAGILRLAHV